MSTTLYAIDFITPDGTRQRFGCWSAPGTPERRRRAGLSPAHPLRALDGVGKTWKTERGAQTTAHHLIARGITAYVVPA